MAYRRTLPAYRTSRGGPHAPSSIRFPQIALVLLLCVLSFYAGLLRNFGIKDTAGVIKGDDSGGCEGLEREVKDLKGIIDGMEREKNVHYDEHHPEDGDSKEVAALKDEIERAKYDLKKSKEDLDKSHTELQDSWSTIDSMKKELKERADAEEEAKQRIVMPTMTPPKGEIEFGETSWHGIERVTVDSILDGTHGFDPGIPPLYGYKGNEEALVLYHKSSEPTDSNDPFGTCKDVDVVVTKRNAPGHCLVLMEHYKSGYVSRFMRVGKTGKKGLSLDNSFTKMGTGSNDDGGGDRSVPLTESKQHWDALSKYFNSFEYMTDKLKPILSNIARDNTVVVMVANAGVLELLTNFVCAANSRKIDISNIVMFATDEEGKKVAEELGLAVFYDEGMFGNVPKEHAGAYGDSVFSALMLVKVISVHLCMSLGYNVLFQDVDIVWLRDPIPYLQDETKHGDFDCYFEDDGVRSARYAPWSANSGFYYLKNNVRTMYLITSLLYSSDQIAMHHSHQQALSHILNDHSTYYGLSLKVLSKELFPGGKSYHHDKPYMLQWMNGDLEEEPYMFHMCWTHNKNDKLNYLQQMGQWFLRHECVNGEVVGRGVSGNLLGCCSTEPVVTCHFKDKPSIIKCETSPNRDQNGKLFWN